MATFLLTWNPDNWAWKNRRRNIEECRTTGKQRQRWSCGNRRSMPVGSRIYLIQLGRRERGIVGSGRTFRAPYKSAHWDPVRRRQGDKALYVGVEFDFLANEPLVERDELDARPFAGVNWSPQASSAASAARSTTASVSSPTK